MRRSLATLIGILVIAAGNVSAGNLYKVTIQSESEASILIRSEIDPVYRGDNTYLILAEPAEAQRLTDAGLSIELVVAGVARSELAFDGRLDRQNIGAYPLAYEDGQVRLFQMAADQPDSVLRQAQVYRLGDMRPKVEYQPPIRTARPGRGATALDLMALINEVSQDSIEDYSHALESFGGRVAGTSNNDAARNWLVAKLQSFGYDSVVVDPFDYNPSSTSGPYENVLAYKVGTLFPMHHIVVGAHRDAVPGSPGADDNGSGSVGVLEIARVLANVPTDFTIVFALFDAEELGLLGSEHYVNRSLIEGRQTMYMLNMDMIAHQDNYNWANLYNGADNSLSLMWGSLADSLLNINTNFNSNSSGSDHFPFTQAGIAATFVQEYYFSTVYHSVHDSTGYLSYQYLTKMIQASLATAYRADEVAQPEPQLTFSYPTGVPEIAVPGFPTVIDVDVSALWVGEVVPGSVQMHYSADDGVTYTATYLTNISGDRYQINLPAVSCDSALVFYLTAEEATTGTVYDHGPDWPYSVRGASSYADSLHDDFESDLGWATTYNGASAGFWVRGVPVNDYSSAYDPMTDGDGSGSCFVTGNGFSNDIDEGMVKLWSPTFDLEAGGTIVYDYFLASSLDSLGTDWLAVEITSDYGTEPFVEVRRYTESIGAHWRHDEISSDEILAAGVNLTSTMRMRFVANDGAPESTVEAALDGFAIRYFDCEAMVCCGQFTGGYTGNVNCDAEGKRNLADVTTLISHVYLAHQTLCCPAEGNISGDPENSINLSDITRLIDHVYISHGETEICR